jgi:selenide,water dikinase
VTGAQKALLCDPQTSGGLLVACARDALADVLAIFARHGGAQANLIGGMVGGAPRVSVEL